MGIENGAKGQKNENKNACRELEHWDDYLDKGKTSSMDLPQH